MKANIFTSQGPNISSIKKGIAQAPLVMDKNED